MIFVVFFIIFSYGSLKWIPILIKYCGTIQNVSKIYAKKDEIEYVTNDLFDTHNIETLSCKKYCAAWIIKEQDNDFFTFFYYDKNHRVILKNMRFCLIGRIVIYSGLYALIFKFFQINKFMNKNRRESLSDEEIDEILKWTDVTEHGKRIQELVNALKKK